VSEGRIIAALRDEVTAAEMHLEDERAAHTSTQRTAAAREQVCHAACSLVLRFWHQTLTLQLRRAESFADTKAVLHMHYIAKPHVQSSLAWSVQLPS